MSEQADQVDPRSVIADAIASTSRDLAESVDTQGAMCTGWVLVAEWTDSDGRWWMSTLSDPQLTELAQARPPHRGPDRLRWQHGVTKGWGMTPKPYRARTAGEVSRWCGRFT